MGWHKTSVEGRVIWERSDGVRVDSTQAIEAIEKAESDALRQSIECMRQRRMEESWDSETWDNDEEYGNPFVPLIFFGILALIYFLIRLLAT